MENVIDAIKSSTDSSEKSTIEKKKKYNQYSLSAKGASLGTLDVLGGLGMLGYAFFKKKQKKPKTGGGSAPSSVLERIRNALIKIGGAIGVIVPSVMAIISGILLLIQELDPTKPISDSQIDQIVIKSVAKLKELTPEARVSLATKIEKALKKDQDKYPPSEDLIKILEEINNEFNPSLSTRVWTSIFGSASAKSTDSGTSVEPLKI